MYLFLIVFINIEDKNIKQFFFGFQNWVSFMNLKMIAAENGRWS